MVAGLGLIVVAATILVLIYVRERDPDARVPSGLISALGQPLPRLELAPLTGEARPLSLADLRDHTTLINFWGPWCAECRVEMPHLQALRKQFAQHKDFELISVSCGPNMLAEDVDSLREQTASYLSDEGFLFPVHCDPSGVTRQALAQIAGRSNHGIGYPLSVVVDRKGLIRGFWMGSAVGVDYEIAKVLEKLLRRP